MSDVEKIISNLEHLSGSIADAFIEVNSLGKSVARAKELIEKIKAFS